MAQTGVLSCTGTLTGSAEEKFTLTSGPGRVEVVHLGTTADPVWCRADGGDATVAGDECYVVRPGDALELKASVVVTGAGQISHKSVVSLISAGAVQVHVAEADS